MEEEKKIAPLSQYNINLLDTSFNETKKKKRKKERKSLRSKYVLAESPWGFYLILIPSNARNLRQNSQV